MAEDLTFAIHPDAGTVSLRLLEKTIEDVRKLVTDVDYAVTRDRVPQKWIVTRLQSTEPTITIRPMLDGRGSVDAVATGLQIVMTGTGIEPPPYFSADALDDLKRMRRLFRGRDKAKRVVFSSDEREVVTVDKRISDRVERIEQGTYSVLGSLEGMLEAVNLHVGSKGFTIWDRVSGLPVRCSLPSDKEWTERVKQLLERRVMVSGKVSYYSNGAPKAITQVTQLADASPDPNLPEGAFGSIPDITGDMEPKEYIKMIRE